jgi:hypothetical protein
MLSDAAPRKSMKQIKVMTANQIADDNPLSNLLPPDILPNIEYRMTVGEARELCGWHKKQHKSNKRKRLFVYGALHKDLYPGYFLIDHAVQGDVDLEVTDDASGAKTVLKVRSAAEYPALLDWIVELGESLPKKGSCRRGLEDLGDMFALGYRSKKELLVYKQTKDPRTAKAMSEVCRRAVPFMERHFPQEVSDIRSAEQNRSGETPPLEEMGGENGPGGTISISRNLGNASHFDYADESLSLSIWAEKQRGQAGNWYFLLPNVTLNGSKGVVIRLHHGLSISWDGTLIRHCTSVTDVGDDNNVFGCMFGGLNDL